MARSACSVSDLPPASRLSVTPRPSFASLVTLAPIRNRMPRFSKAFCAAALISASSIGRMRSSASTTVTSAPRAR